MQKIEREKKKNLYVYPGVCYKEWKKTEVAKREIANDNSFTQMDLKILKKLKKNHVKKEGTFQIFDDNGKLKYIARKEFIEHYKDSWGFCLRTWFCENNKEITPKILHDFLRSLTPDDFAAVVYSDKPFPSHYTRPIHNFFNFSDTDNLIKQWEGTLEWFEYCYYMEQFHNDNTFFTWIIG